MSTVIFKKPAKPVYRVTCYRNGKIEELEGKSYKEAEEIAGACASNRMDVVLEEIYKFKIIVKGHK